MKEITPEHLKCGLGQCPAVYEDGDRIIIRGSYITASEHSLPHAPMWEAYIAIPRAFYDALLANEEESK